ncbi:MAG: hypothetical protein RhofKO_16870 [Rhodothermales bacterium]
MQVGMQRFPYVTDYVNELFEREKQRFDYRVLRPVFLILYFFLRLVIVPLKFVLHRRKWGFEGKLIDGVLAIGIKYFASHDAITLLVRHVQIEPVVYRYLLSGTPAYVAEGTGERLKGIDGDFGVDSIRDVVAHGLTLCHDDLAYEVFERFDKDAFLADLNDYRHRRPDDIAQFSNRVLDQNRAHSWQLFGATNVIIFIVVTITLFGDYRSITRALNSFDSDSLLLWCLKAIYADDPQTLNDLDFYLQDAANRSHYNNSPFRTDPSQYLYHHIAFDEYAYARLRQNPDLT